MGSRCINKDTDQNVQRYEEASYAKECLQKVHFDSYPLGGCL